MFSYDDKVSKYWPEFGKNGKENVTIADVLRHEGGVPYFDGEQPKYEDVKDLDALKVYFEEQKHCFDGENVRAYHCRTRGFILNEVVRRVHEKNYTIGKIYEEINPLLNIEFHLGLPEELEIRRSVWYRYPMLDIISILLPKIFVGDKKYKLNYKIMAKDAIFPKILKFKLGEERNIENSRDFAGIESPSTNGFTNSASVSILVL